MIGSHWLDATPGCGRYSRAVVVAAFVQPDDLDAARERNRTELEEWLALDLERSTCDSKRQCAARLKRAAVARIAVRLQHADGRR